MGELVITEEVKKEVLEKFIIEVGKMSIMTFTVLGLKTHIDGMVIDDDTKEEYIITVNKVSNGALFKDGGIVFTRKQRNEHSLGFAKFCFDYDRKHPKHTFSYAQLLIKYETRQINKNGN